MADTQTIPAWWPTEPSAIPMDATGPAGHGLPRWPRVAFVRSATEDRPAALARHATRRSLVLGVDPAAAYPAEGAAARHRLARRLPRRPHGAARPDSPALGVRRARPYGSAGRQQAGGRTAGPRVRQLYALHFPIRHLQLADAYGPSSRSPPTMTQRRRSSAGRPCRRRVPGQRHRHLVKPRLRARGRPQPCREPLRRLRDVARPKRLAYVDRSRIRRGWSPRQWWRRFARSAGAGAARGRAPRRTTCTSPGTGTRPQRAGSLW